MSALTRMNRQISFFAIDSKRRLSQPEIYNITNYVSQILEGKAPQNGYGEPVIKVTGAGMDIEIPCDI